MLDEIPEWRVGGGDDDQALETDEAAQRSAAMEAQRLRRAARACGWCIAVSLPLLGAWSSAYPWCLDEAIAVAPLLIALTSVVWIPALLIGIGFWVASQRRRPPAPARPAAEGLPTPIVLAGALMLTIGLAASDLGLRILSRSSCRQLSEVARAAPPAEEQYGADRRSSAVRITLPQDTGHYRIRAAFRVPDGSVFFRLAMSNEAVFSRDGFGSAYFLVWSEGESKPQSADLNGAGADYYKNQRVRKLNSSWWYIKSSWGDS